MKNAEKTGFNELRFGDGSGHAKQRLTGKENRSFRQRPNVACKLKSRQIVKETRMNAAEGRERAKIGNVFARKTHILQKVEGLLQTRSHQIIAPVREVANKEFKRGEGLETVLDVPGRHREFVEVGK